MFRRYPYGGWLLLCVLLWSITGYYLYSHRQDTRPEKLAAAVNADVQRMERTFDNLLADQNLVRRMCHDSLNLPEVRMTEALPFYLFALEGNALRYWNTNAILPEPYNTVSPGVSLITNERGVFIQKVTSCEGGQRLVALMPIQISYPVENDYLQSHFSASAYIGAGTRIMPAEGRPGGSYPVTMRNGQPVCYLLLSAADAQKWVPDQLFLALMVAAVLASVSWVNLMLMHLTRKRNALAGLVGIVAVIAAVRIWLYLYGPPFNLDTLLFFSPQLYASSAVLPSFGDLFINTLCVLWLIIFVTRHTPYKTYFANTRSPLLRKVLPPLFATLMGAWLLFFTGLVRSLVLDSSISFDVSRFNTVNVYTLLGLLEVCIITGISCMVISILNFQLVQLLQGRVRRYAFIVVSGVLVMAVTGSYTDVLYWCLLAWLLVFVILLDYPKLKLVSDLFEPQMIVWALFIGAFCTGLVQYFNTYREKEARKAYVEQHLAPRRDNLLEYGFDRTANMIEHDAVIKSFFANPTPAARKMVNRRLDSLYSSSVTSRYDPQYYLYNEAGVSLLNRDSVSLSALTRQKEEAIATGSPNLFYKESIPDRNAYLSWIPIYSDTINQRVGYVLIDMTLKKQAAETVFPELLLPGAGKAGMREKEYLYAVYVNNRLVTRGAGYPFVTTLPANEALAEDSYTFIRNGNVSELWYRVSDKRTIVVVHDSNVYIETITVFFYVFCMQVLLALIILLYQIYLSYFAGWSARRKYMRLTLRKRIQYAMLGVVSVSFVIIGIVTIAYFTSRYRAASTARLQTSMQTARQALQGYLNAAHAYDNAAIFDSVTQSVPFRKFMTTVATSQKIDINLFDNNGYLFAASEDEIYQKGLLARIMRKDALYQISKTGRSVLIQDERVAGLSYLSAYEPISDENGEVLGYLNVPFFSSEKEIKFQVSNIVITLINVYAFIFLIASLITVYITRWVTGSFNVIIGQFGRLNLQQNERIQWPYDDEIGLLVAEYNKMVNTVEENAALLARSERETAWREMARQVAHEIKNPLTPMKLNIQYLLQAVRNDAPNIKELAQRVSESVIEQIDNLTYIASEFSNFAKMPEAQPEVLDLAELLDNATGLYRNEQDLTVELLRPEGAVNVWSDHSQMLRLFTNLLENAKQAIPEGQKGLIQVRLVRGDNTVTVSVTDNGVGISPDVASRIFQPYFTTKTSGTGLGLAMTKKIIEFWKGAIWFESAHGQGTTFYIRMLLHHKENGG